LKIPPKQNPTIEIMKKYQNAVRSPGGNLNRKKHPNRTAINGIIISPLLIIFLKRNPIVTDPKIAETS
jgi:hypothetical protein